MTYPDRFMTKVKKVGDCWLWTAAKHRQGYGNFYWGGAVLLAHRVSYFFATGIMPHPSLKVCHRCDTPSCVKPVAGVEVKPLEWSKTSYGRPEVETVVGVYRVFEHVDGGWAATFKTFNLVDAHGRKNFATEHEALTAAEADYRNRILSTLLPKATALQEGDPPSSVEHSAFCFELRPMATAPSGNEAMEPLEIEVHEGAWAVVIGTNGKAIGWVDTHALFEGRTYRDRLLPDTAPVVSEPVAWCNTTMSAIATLSRSVDGAFSTKILAHAGKDPKGEMQDYEGPHVAGVTHEWVDQSGPGMSGDDFSGTVTFVLGDFHLVVEYAT